MEAGAEDTAVLLEALFTQAPQGLFVYAEDLRVLRFNPASRGVRGVPPGRVVGHRHDEFAPYFTSPELPGLLRAVVSDGTLLRGYVVRGRRPSDPGKEMVVSITAFPVRYADGRVVGVAAVEDVTSRQQAADRLGILARSHSRIGSTLDARTTGRELAETLVPAFADAVTVDLADRVLSVAPDAALPSDGALRLTRVASPSLGGPAGPEEPGGFDFLPPFLPPPGQVEPWLAEDLDTDHGRYGASAPRIQALLDVGVHSVIVAPLTVHSTMLGVAVFYRYARAEPFARADVDLAAQLAAKAAVAVDLAFRHARERATVSILQRHLVPRGPSALTAVETVHVHEPGTAVSDGDWFDVIPLPGARVALTFGRAAGRGIEAAAAMGRLRTALRALAVRDMSPEDLLTCLDETAGDIAADYGFDEVGSGFASCVYVVYDPVTGSVSAARAGSLSPVVIAPDGTPVPFDLPDCPELGTDHGSFQAADMTLQQGSLIILHTRPERADALHRAVVRPDADLRQLREDVVQSLSPGPGDGASALLARTRALPSDRVATWTLPEEPEVVRTARQLVDHQLQAWNIPEAAFEMELIVSELVTNALRYGRPPVRLQLILDQHLICEVSDGSSTAPHLKIAAPTDEGGRGLYIVRCVAKRWGTRFLRGGKIIWAEQRLPEPAQNLGP
ncbi:SpoIIE family protein phosphatase [Streptomyces gardneri]|uniref:ATP-binding SpoIIE family protein phosphatase n=1 Tax=Streptomyces gardneri TaxID=66892 RepID=UPI00368C871B